MLAQQQACDRALRLIFREPERIARGEAVIDDKPRQQEPSRVAAQRFNAPGLPGKLHRTCDMIEQAGGTPRFGLIVGTAGDFPREADRGIGQAAQAIAPCNRHAAAVVEACVQIRRQRRFGSVPADRAL